MQFEKIPAAQICVECGHALRPAGLFLTFVKSRRVHGRRKSSCHRDGNLRLQSKNIGHRPFKTIAPDRRSIAAVAQIRRDLDPVTCFLHIAIKQERDAKFPGNFYRPAPVPAKLI